MVLTKEQAEKIKEHLLKQLGNFPEEKREQIKEQVESMTTTQVENFVEENKLDHLSGCLFCSIIGGKTSSFKIAEDENNVAVLDINPISPGNTIVIPKKHASKILPSSLEFAKLVSKRIEERMGPREIKMHDFEAMGHQIVEIVPIYGDETDRKKASEEELKAVQERIAKEKKEEKAEVKEVIEKVEEIVKLRPRIP